MSNKRRKPSAWPSIISLSSVMFMLGLLGFSIVGFQGLSQHLMESSSIDLYFVDGSTEAQVRKIEQSLLQEPWIKTTKFISPKDGVKEMSEKYDPMNVHRLQIGFAAAAIISLIVAIALIQSATRLSIFANRFLIKSMQLVGATNKFIVRPYVMAFVRHSLIAMPIAMGLLLIIFYGLPYIFQDFAIINDFTKHIGVMALFVICISVSIFGLILAVFGSWLSTRRYLRTKIENLY